MIERPILFSAPMIRAILDGRKTQTRRAVKPQPEPGTDCPYHVGAGLERSSRVCPFGRVGALLWVREAWRAPSGFDDTPPRHIPRTALIRYTADGRDHEDFLPSKVRPSIHMPRWASRITLKITGVRIERLQDISEADAAAEGIAMATKDGRLHKYGIPDIDGHPGTDDFGWPWKAWQPSPRAAFQRLWESINGPGSWGANPWVWAISFDVFKENVDEILKP